MRVILVRLKLILKHSQFNQPNSEIHQNKTRGQAIDWLTFSTHLFIEIGETNQIDMKIITSSKVLLWLRNKIDRWNKASVASPEDIKGINWTLLYPSSSIISRPKEPWSLPSILRDQENYQITIQQVGSPTWTISRGFTIFQRKKVQVWKNRIEERLSNKFPRGSPVCFLQTSLKFFLRNVLHPKGSWKVSLKCAIRQHQMFLHPEYQIQIENLQKIVGYSFLWLRAHL